MVARDWTRGRAAERAALWVTVAATAWFVAAISWGLCARVAAGHDGVIASRGIVAENMRCWGILAPVRDYALERPAHTAYYAHHPWGSFWAIAAFAAALGRHAYVPRLVAVLTSAAAPPLLFAIARMLWGPLPGAVAALAYATLPMTLAFGNFPGFEVTVVTSCLLVAWSQLHFARTRRTRWMAIGLAAVAWCANSDWEASIFLAPALALPGALLFFGRAAPHTRSELRSFGQWASLAAFVTLATLAAYVAYFQSIDALTGLLAQGTRRSNGNGSPLAEVLSERAYWIDVTFTPLAVLAGKLAVPLFLWRLFVLGRALEAFPLALLVMAIVEYLQFKNGADVHIYWPYPFAPYYALSLGLIAHTAIGAARAAAALLGRPAWAPRTSGLAALAVGLVPLAILPDGVRGLWYERVTGGRFNDRGRPISREEDKSQALEWMAPLLPPRTAVALHQSMRPNWGQPWALHRPTETVNDVPVQRSGDERPFVADLGGVAAADQVKLAQAFPVTAVGRYALALRSAPLAPVQGFVFEEREPDLREWYLSNGVDRVRTVVPDPFFTWELRAHYAQQPNPSPEGPPRCLDQVRIAHDVAVAAGDGALADRYEAELRAQLDAGVATTFSDGTRLLGQVYRSGVAPTLTLYFKASGPARDDFPFEIASMVEEAPRFSLVPRDDRSRQVPAPFLLPMRLWKKDFIYTAESEIRKRPGRERFVGYFGGAAGEPGPHALDRSGWIPLLILP
ncbi:MAG: glycosyltransferase family 39 protein [Myxococcales bacterium]|nr:glycosyltransferase family 39 protein [Myxococcales bacterium]